jgi:putative membrane protein
MRLPTLLLWLAGLLAIAALLATHDIDHVIEPVLALRFTLLAVIAFHLAPLVLDVAAWRVLFAHRPPWPRLMLLRWASDGVNGLLPVPHLGELLRVFGLGPAASRSEAAATVVVDITLALASEVAFAALGITLYMERVDSGPLPWLVAATGCLAALGLALYLIQQRGLFALGGTIARRAGQLLKLDLAVDGAAAVDDHLRSIYRRRRDVAAGFGWRLAAWIAGSGEVWIAARGLGLPLGLGDALILESLSQMVRTVGFAMPGGLGLQEGVLVLIGPQLGIDAESALSLALVRRARELAFGGPGLLAGWWLQRRALHSLPASAPAAPEPIERSAPRARL